MDINDVIPADAWPEWADRHCWDESGFGYFYGVQKQVALWASIDMPSKIPLPPGHDWRVPVMRPQEAPAIDLGRFREAVEALHAANIAQELAREPGYPSIQFQRTAQKCSDLMALIDGQASPDLIGDALSAMGSAYPLTGAGMQAALASEQPTKGEVAESPATDAEAAFAIIDEFIQCAEAGRPPGKLLAQARDYLAANSSTKGEGVGSE